MYCFGELVCLINICSSEILFLSIKKIKIFINYHAFIVIFYVVNKLNLLSKLINSKI